MIDKKIDEADVFNVARKIEHADARAEYLRQVCGNDENLRERVAQLLSSFDDQPSFLVSPPSGVGATLDMPAIMEKPGTVIGPYKLLEQIGEGGMGVVYVAQQEQPVKRKVALKIIKPGMDTRQVITRFEAERQALALMDHPNIAKVLDAGTTGDPQPSRGASAPGSTHPAADAARLNDVTGSTGRPFFVMELVRGIPITEYCDQSQLTTDQRLDLFIKVCRAIQHAHQKGIIHRDIKPTNVLVTQIDGAAIPKVIDFGVAKAINRQLTEQTLYTAHSQMIGTPLYMSPEQAQMSGVDVDTRSDVYSLGVLLYELLTGSTPFDKETLKQAGFDEMRRIIREEEPPRPSDRISTLNAEALSTLTTQRNIDARLLCHQVQGELDWIAMRALEKDRTRRYESASAFAADILRYLDDEPVAACPPSAAYRLRKYARRNKGVLTTLILVSISLLTGTAVSAWQAVEANDARNLANQLLLDEQDARNEADRQRIAADENRRRSQSNFREALQALTDLVSQINDPNAESVRDEASQEVLRYFQLLAESRASGSLEQRKEAGMALVHIGRIHSILRNDAAAEIAYTDAVAVFRELNKVASLLGDSWKELAIAENILGLHLYSNGRFDAARAAFAECKKSWEKDYQSHPHDLGILCGYSHCLSMNPDCSSRDSQKAFFFAKEALRITSDSRSAWRSLGIAEYRSCNWNAALEHLEHAAEMPFAEEDGSPNYGDDPFIGLFLAMTHYRLGHNDQALSYYREGVAVIEKYRRFIKDWYPLRAEAEKLLGIPVVALKPDQNEN